MRNSKIQRFRSNKYWKCGIFTYTKMRNVLEYWKKLVRYFFFSVSSWDFQQSFCSTKMSSNRTLERRERKPRISILFMEWFEWIEINSMKDNNYPLWMETWSSSNLDCVGCSLIWWSLFFTSRHNFFIHMNLKQIAWKKTI